MSVVVITPPASLVSVTDAKIWAPVLADDASERVEALLKVAQAAIEPPNGWVGRAFGVQTLELRAETFSPSIVLPYPPLRSVASVKYLDATGADVTLDAAHYRVSGVGGAGRVEALTAWPFASFQAESVRVRFEAGYAAGDPQLLPVRHAIVLAATSIRALATQDLALRSRTVEGVGSRTWTVSDAAAKLVEDAVGRLLMPYRVWS